MFAAFGSLLSIILVLIFIPHIPKTKSSASKDSNSTTGAGLFDNLSAITKIVFLPNVGFLLFLKLVCGIPIGVLQSMFSSKENTKIQMVKLSVTTKKEVLTERSYVKKLTSIYSFSVNATLYVL